MPRWPGPSPALRPLNALHVVAAALLLTAACDCGGSRAVTVEVPMTVEAGPDMPMPDETRSKLPMKLEFYDDEASAERTVNQLKELGLEHLIDD